MYAVRSIPPFEVYYRKGTADEEVISQSFKNDIFYKYLPDLSLGESPLVLDVGAHIGTFSMLTASRNPRSTIYAIEAGGDSFGVLKENITRNKIQNVTCFQYALADKDGEVQLYHSDAVGNWGFSITKDLGGTAERVRAISFDNFISQNDINTVDFLKSNCEGAEFGIFLNASDEAIRKIKFGLILYHGDLEKAYSVQQLMDKFKKNNFIVELFNKTSRRGWLVVKNRSYYRADLLASFLRSKYVFKIREKLNS